jgi:glycosyltransferase involved in cell wall biosynthesis
MVLKIAAFECFPTSQRGGSEKAFFEVLIGLSKLHFQILLFYNIYGDLIPKYEAAGIKCIKIPSLKIDYFSLKNWCNLLIIGKKISNIKPDFLYINYLADSPMAAVTKLFSKKIKTICHLRVPKIGESRVFNFCGKYIDLFISVNLFIKKEYQSIFKPAKIIVINDGIIIPYKIYPLKLSKNFSATYLGRISHEKGILELIDAWQILIEKYQLKILLSITGPAVSDAEIEYKKKVATKIKTLKYSEIISIENPVNNVINHLKAFDFSLFPSIIDESFGRTISESILAGVPVFSRNVGIVNEILAPEKQTLIFKDEEELAYKIDQFYKGNIVIDMEGLQKHVIKNYNVDENVKLIAKHLETLSFG